MKKLLFLVALSSLGLWSCTDKCSKTQIIRRTNSLQLSYSVVRNGIKVIDRKDMINAGKIYTKDQYLFINEIKEGVHVFDNSNPASPKEVAFINIPGCSDMAIKNNTLFVDSYMDMVGIDITNPRQAREVSRVKDVYFWGTADGLSWSADSVNKVIYDTQGYWEKQTVLTSCDEQPIVPVFWGWRGLEDASFLSSKSAGSNGTSSTGTGGSTARFTISQEHLYTVSQNGLQVFNIENELKPQKLKSIELGWGIETIFPYKDKLFVGSNTGLFIFDNSDPGAPKQASAFSHARACDPVVADDQYAYVTLRTNNSWCGGNANQLDVIDISSIYTPKLVKTYPMSSPYGLSKAGQNLYICEGKNGFKSLNASNVLDIKLIEHLKDLSAYDVIALEKTLLVIGRDGLYQLDAKTLATLSKIEVLKPSIN